jgi:hypothetical protein
MFPVFLSTIKMIFLMICFQVFPLKCSLNDRADGAAAGGVPERCGGPLLQVSSLNVP